MDLRTRSRSPRRAGDADSASMCLEQRRAEALHALAEFEETSWAERNEADASACAQLVEERLKLLLAVGEVLGYPPESWLYTATATELESVLPQKGLDVDQMFRPCRAFSPRSSEGRSSLQQNNHYTSENHIEMVLDTARVAAFELCIRRAAAGKRVLDVGSGAFCLLGRLALKAGAALVHSVEQSPASVAYARKLFEMEMARVELPPLQWLRRTPAALCPDRVQLLFPESPVRRWEIHVEDAIAGDRIVHEAELRDHEPESGYLGSCRGTVLLWPEADAEEEFPTSLELHEGLCADISLPGEYDLVVHEVLGYMASSEGVVPTIRDTHSRHLLQAGCLFIPAAAGTYLAPTERIELTSMECALHQLFNGEAWLAVNTRYNARNFNSCSFLAEPEVFEWFRFDTATTLVDQERMVEFRTNRPGHFDGLHFHLLVEMDASTTLNVLAVPTTWCTLYVRLLEEAIFLPAESLITCQCTAAATGAMAEYSVQVWLGRPAMGSPPLASFRWEGCS